METPSDRHKIVAILPEFMMIHPMNVRAHTATLFLLVLLTNSNAWGVVVATPAPGNLPGSAPANGAPWNNVLRMNTASGVYIGGGWVLTAEHVFDDNVNPFVIYNSTPYLADLSKSYVLNNPADFPSLGLTTESDVVLFRLQNAIPELPTIPLGQATANLGITMIGFGGGKSWGSNNVEGPPVLTNVNWSSNDFRAFISDYDTATQSEGQGIGGDSGGGAFAFQGGKWKLAGIMNAVDTVSSPQLTVFADISTYSAQINDIILTQGSIPEPSSLLLTTPALLFLLRRRRCETHH